MRVRWIGLAALCAATATCGTLLSTKFDHELNDKYGKPNPATFDQRPAPAPGAVSYEREIRPLFERRCVVCHACYDASCQLKMESWDGIARGASKEPVYKGARLRDAELTRLYQDASSPSGWRERGFFPVLNERGQSRDANLAGSLLYQLLAQKRRHPTPAGGLLPSTFKLELDTERKCPRLEEQPEYEKDQPLWGMPYGMPALEDAEFALVERWLAAGSPAEPSPPLPAAVQDAGPDLGSVLQRRFAETAAGLALPVRAPVPGAPALRRRFRPAVLSPGALANAAGPADRTHRHPAAV